MIEENKKAQGLRDFDLEILVDELAEVMQNVATVGWLDETDTWIHPEWAYQAVNVIAQCRRELQQLIKAQKNLERGRFLTFQGGQKS